MCAHPAARRRRRAPRVSARGSTGSSAACRSSATGLRRADATRPRRQRHRRLIATPSPDIPDARPRRRPSLPSLPSPSQSQSRPSRLEESSLPSLPEPAERPQRATAAARSTGREPAAEELRWRPRASLPAECHAAGRRSSSRPVDVRRLWPGVLDRVKKMKRCLDPAAASAQVRDVDDGHPDGRVQRGRARELLRQRPRRDPAAGLDRRVRRRLAGRGDHRRVDRQGPRGWQVATAGSPAPAGVVHPAAAVRGTAVPTDAPWSKLGAADGSPGLGGQSRHSAGACTSRRGRAGLQRSYRRTTRRLPLRPTPPAARVSGQGRHPQDPVGREAPPPRTDEHRAGRPRRRRRDRRRDGQWPRAAGPRARRCRSSTTSGTRR